MTHDLIELDPLAEKMSSAIRPVLEREVERRVGEVVAQMKRRQKPRDRALMEACRKVAEAVDRLEQERFGPGEISARMALGRAAERLRAVMRRPEPPAGLEEMATKERKTP